MAIINGTVGDDILDGGNEQDILHGLGGNDRLFGGLGTARDALYGEAGDDTLIGGQGDDYVTGALGNDRYVFRRGDDSDTVFDNNSVATTAAADIAAAQAAGVGPGAIVNTWSNGYLWNSSLGRLYKLTDSGTDTLALEGGTKATDLSMSWTSNGDLTIDIGPLLSDRVLIKQQGVAASRIDKLQLDGQAAMNFAVSRGPGVLLQGSAGADILFGLEDASRIYGLDGNDVISGGGGADSLYGFNGDDTLAGGWDDDYVTGGLGNDRYEYRRGDGSDQIFDLNFVATTAAADIAAAQAAGVRAGGIVDTWSNGYLWNASLGRLYKLTESGTDTLVLEGITRRFDTEITGGDLSMSWTSHGDLVIDIDRGLVNQRILIYQQGVAASRIEKLQVFGLDAMNFAVSKGPGVALDGSAAADLLFGLAGNDRINGRDGNDVIYGKQGDDALYGGLGNDRYVFRRGEGSDRIFDDNAVATAAADDIAAAQALGVHAGGIVDTWSNGYLWNASLGQLYKLTDSGTDTLVLLGATSLAASSMSWTSDGDLVIDFQTSGRIYIYQQAVAGSRIEKIALGFSEDSLQTINFAVAQTNGSVTGHATESSFLFGVGGNESLVGGTGDDFFDGGAGNDRLSGGEGADRLSSGAGADTFLFNAALGAANVDRITDFSSADDTIELDSAIFTALTPGQLAGAFAANLDGVAVEADDRILYETDVGRLYYDYDGTGPGSAVQIAWIEFGRVVMTADDFIVV